VVSLKLAILGTRGVPPSYGGFETFAGEISTRLARRGHDVSVYCRSGQRAAGSDQGSDAQTPARRPLPAARWNGVHRITLPAIRHKYFETVSHALLSALDALRRDFDAVLVCNAANAFVLPLLRAKRTRVAINVDGIERRRRKWNALGRAVYAIGEALSASFATVVADAEVIAQYYREQYQIEPVVIPYGAEFPEEEDSDVLQRLGVKDYILYVSRFEPENNPLEVVREYERLSDAPPLVMVGTGLYAHDLVAELHRHAGDKILFPGAIYGRDYRTLQRNALLYIQATEVGGTHPALIEAMASGGRVLAHGTPENREVGGDAVGYFDVHVSGELSGMISEFLRNPLQRDELRAQARRRASRLYSWERVTDAYERLFESLPAS
jgi:glycosyltransferase involved in cell wall biosynthesis